MYQEGASLYIHPRFNGDDGVGLDIRFSTDGAGGDIVGEIDVEVIASNIVITVRREDEAHFGPVSTVIV